MLRVCFLYLLFVWSFAVSANDVKPSLIALELSGLTDAQKKGAYSNLYGALTEEGHLSSWEPAPVLRAHQIFVNKEASCLAPTSLRTLAEYNIQPDQLAEVVPFNRVLGYLFQASDYMLEAGEDPSLGTVGLGFMFGVEQNAYKIVNVASYEQLLSLVINSRLSAVYINYPDVLADEKAKEILSTYEGNVELRWDSRDSIICWKEHTSAMEAVKGQLEVWQASGQLKKMLGKYYVDLKADANNLIR